MSLTPAKYTFTVYTGTTLRKQITLLTGGVGSTPQNLSGYTASMVIKDAPLGTTLLTLSTADDTIVLGGMTGTIDLTLPAAATSAITWKHGVYELLITAPGPGDTDILLVGNMKVIPF